LSDFYEGLVEEQKEERDRVGVDESIVSLDIE